MDIKIDRIMPKGTLRFDKICGIGADQKAVASADRDALTPEKSVVCLPVEDVDQAVGASSVWVFAFSSKIERKFVGNSDAPDVKIKA